MGTVYKKNKICQNPYPTCALGKNSFLISQLVALHDFSHLRKAFQTSSSWCLPAFPLVPLRGTELSSNTLITLFPFLPLHCGCGKDPKEARSPIAALLPLNLECLPSAKCLPHWEYLLVTLIIVVKEWSGRVTSFTS